MSPGCSSRPVLANQRRSSPTNSLWIPGLTAGTLYYFSVRAEDSANNVSPWSTPAVSNTVRDTTSPTLTTPAVIAGGAATGGTGGAAALSGHVDVSWDSITTNSETLACEVAGSQTL